MKIAAVLGTCSEAIKLAPVLRDLRADQEMECHVCVTDQRQQEVDNLLEGFEIVPDSCLDLTAPGLSLSGLTSVAITMLDGFLRRETPHLIILEGASTISLAAALAAFYRNIPILHLEPAPRSDETDSPWPEEANHVLIRRLAELHFAATSGSLRNPLAERVSPESVIVTGSTLIDAFCYAVARVRQVPQTIPGIPPPLMQADSSTPLVLIAGRGHERFDSKLESLCSAIAELAEAFPQAHFVSSIRMGENARESAGRVLAARKNLHLIQSVPYFAFVALMDRANVILTDSQGVQKEACALGKALIALPEDGGQQDSGKDGIVAETSLLLSDDSYLASRSRVILSCEDGRAAGRIVRAIKTRYGRSASPVPWSESVTLS